MYAIDHLHLAMDTVVCSVLVDGIQYVLHLLLSVEIAVHTFQCEPSLGFLFKDLELVISIT